MWRLFVNADDFGLTDGVSEGIAAAMEAGLVGGTTAMVCPAGAEARLRRWGSALAGRVGLHLQLTGGVPCLPVAEIPSLVGPDGAFPRKKMAVGNVDPDQVRREWRGQVARLRACGIEPSHVDTHHHIHKRSDVFPIFLELARELKVPARALTDGMRRALDAAGVPHTDCCITDWFDQDTTPRRLLALVDKAIATLPAGGTIEIMTHPGHCDAALEAISTYAGGRDVELGVLTDPDLGRTLRERGILVIEPAVLARVPGA